MRESPERIVEVPDCSKASFLLALEYLSCGRFRAVGGHVPVRRAKKLQETNDLSCLCEGLIYFGRKASHSQNHVGLAYKLLNTST